MNTFSLFMPSATLVHQKCVSSNYIIKHQHYIWLTKKHLFGANFKSGISIRLCFCTGMSPAEASVSSSLSQQWFILLVIPVQPPLFFYICIISWFLLIGWKTTMLPLGDDSTHLCVSMIYGSGFDWECIGHLNPVLIPLLKQCTGVHHTQPKYV